MRKASAISAHEATSKVTEIAVIYNLNVTCKPGKEIPMGDALCRDHLLDAVPNIEPVMFKI